MPDPALSKKETALRALLAALETLPALFEDDDWSLAVARNATALLDFREGGAEAHLVLRDGDTGEPVESELSPVLHHYEHVAKLVLQVAKHRADADAIFDRVQLAVAHLFDAEADSAGDPTIGGAVDYAELGGLNTEEIDEAFEIDWKAAILPLTLFYSSPVRLG
ncbi:hypothetical protein [Parvibaculum sp.]|uniref:hypothetical protein n=1 Tax=Parvibaculum sp. TaxID=2024848 RepID=UPI001D5D800C|nr:hypothetical protein [Parvibaculum sp.]MBX3488869.1 hypothetical protein [Parvibaculum sp.]